MLKKGFKFDQLRLKHIESPISMQISRIET